MADFQKIHPKREPLEREIAVSSVREDLPVVVGVADDLHRILQRQPSWVRHVQAEFSCVALRR
jgi:hypothetical protein